MRRSLLILLALLAVTWFEFKVYPGHNFLAGETRLLAPMLERLDTPGFLSRDLVASHPIFAYTIYDEVTLLLHAHLTLEQALTYQQAVFRFIAVVGIFLLARAVQSDSWAAVVISALVNAVTHLAAPHAFVTSPDPTPVSFALSLVFLAAGLLVSRFTLLAGLAGGIALLYDPVTTMPFWVIVFGLAVVNPSVRRSLRPAFLAFLIFSLLLGNFSQMQAGIGGGQDLTKHLDDAAAHLTRIRTPWIWVSQWAGKEIWSYLLAAVVALLALMRLGSRVNALPRIVLAGLVAGGLVSAVGACAVLLLRLQFATSMPLAANLTLTVAGSLVLAAAAGWQAMEARRWTEGFIWSLFVGCSLINAQILDLSHGETALSAMKPAVTPELRQLAQWADENTWGSSMFEFPDAGVGTAPGVFRALSRRSLWADWQSGVIADYSDEAGQQWWERWQTAGLESYSPSRLNSMLRLPVDYYVLSKPNALPSAKPVFANRLYLVYDAQDLRKLMRLD